MKHLNVKQYNLKPSKESIETLTKEIRLLNTDADKGGGGSKGRDIALPCIQKYN